jgi:uncharacterized protein YeaC (DUF1315 family)
LTPEEKQKFKTALRKARWAKGKRMTKSEMSDVFNGVQAVQGLTGRKEKVKEKRVYEKAGPETMGDILGKLMR